MPIDISKEWCRVEEHKGGQVLLRRGYNSDNDDFEMAIEIRAEDFVPGAEEAGVGFVVARVAGQEEAACSDNNWKQFCGLGEYDKPMWPVLADKQIDAVKAIVNEEESD